MTTENPTPETTTEGETAAPSLALGRALRAVAAAGGVLTLIAGLWLGWRAGLSAAIGAGIAVANLYVLGRVVASLLSGGAQRGAWGVVGLLKLGVLFGGLWAMFRSGQVAVLPLLMGYGALPLGISLTPLFGRDEPATPAPPSSPSSTTSSQT